MRKKLLSIFLAFSLLLVPKAINALGNITYVSLSGNDQNPCTLLSPCRTITHGIAVASIGDTVSVSDGTYLENINVSKSIILQGSGKVIIDGANLSIQNGGGVINIPSGVNGATVSGFEIRNGKQYGISVFGNGNTISNNQIHGIYGPGLWVRDAVTNQFLSNEIYNTVLQNSVSNNGGVLTCSPTNTAWPSAINSWGSSAFNTYKDNYIHDNCGEGVVAHSNDIIEHNTFKNNWSIEIYLASVQLTTVKDNIIVDDRPYTVRGSDQVWRAVPAGIAIADEVGCTASDNLITGNSITGSRYGFSFYAYSACSGIRNTQIINNTVVGAREYGFRLLTGTHSNSILRNNIINLTGAIARPMTIQSGTFTITSNYFQSDTTIFEYNGKSYSNFTLWSAVVPGNFWGLPTSIPTDTPRPITQTPTSTPTRTMTAIPPTNTSIPAITVTATMVPPITPTRTLIPPSSTPIPTTCVQIFSDNQYNFLACTK